MNTTRLRASFAIPSHAPELALDPLIKEARDRQHRRRRRLLLLLAALLVAAGVASYGAFRPGGGGPGPAHPPVLTPQGIEGVSLGTQQSQTVAELSRLLGPPTRSFTNGGCGARYVEVEWGQLYVEFRQSHFSGFRYMTGTWPPYTGSGRTAAPPGPKLVTTKGLTLGNTLGQLSSDYGRLDLIGTDRWQTSNGLVFYDNAEHDPPPATSQIIEIKYGTCGDF